MIVDIAITVVLCWYLSSEKVYVRRKYVPGRLSEAGKKADVRLWDTRTHRLINKIIVFSVNRGAIAAYVVGSQIVQPC